VIRSAVRVVAVGDLREPLRARATAGCLRVAVVFGLAHDLRHPVRPPRILGAVLEHLANTRRTTTRKRMIDRPFCCTEHLFVFYPLGASKSVPK